MITQAVIVRDDFIVSQNLERIYEGDITVDCNAILMAFMASRPEDIEGGVLYATGCVGLTEASLIISAKLTKVVFSREPVLSDELCAIELLKEHDIIVSFNPNIILG